MHGTNVKKTHTHTVSS